MERNREPPRRRGFTMAEALTVMGIIVVLAAAAVPSGMGAMKNVRQIQLNRSAETIYMTAQLNLIAAKVSGKSVPGTVTATKDSNEDTKNMILPANSISPALYAGNWAIVYSGWTVETAYYSEATETWDDDAGFTAWQNMAATNAGKVGKYGK